MILLALGKKGSGKSAAVRKLVFHRLKAPHRPLVFWHDPQCQLDPSSGKLFSDIGHARELALVGALPQLCIFRGVDVDDIAKLALQVHDVTLVIDELDRACSGKTWSSDAVKRIVHEGRHERVDLFGTFRSTRNVSEDLLGQADHVLLFRHSASSYYDLQTIQQRFGEQLGHTVTTLEPLQFVIWSDD